DTYVHDSRAGFAMPIVRGLYLTRRSIISPSGKAPAAALQPASDALQVDARNSLARNRYGQRLQLVAPDSAARP
ncbi:hypothetical protein, partial [Mesorhizobium sp. M2D.F.Ca.ET.153.01.1.1]